MFLKAGLSFSRLFGSDCPLMFKKFQFLGRRSDLKNQVLIFNPEQVLLRSSCLFPYFMLVAFEAGSLIRAVMLFLLYPVISLCSPDFGLKIMTMISFVGLKEEKFMEGRTVLPKFFLEDVGMESFEVIRQGRVTVAVSDLPQVMIESFLKDYLDIHVVIGRDLKSFHGYFLGVLDERRKDDTLDDVVRVNHPNVIGFGCLTKSLPYCKEIYSVSEQERRNWHQLPRYLYPKPLIFHDGRLAFRPSFLATLAIFMWLPMGLSLAIFRTIISLTLPDCIKFVILHLTGARIRVFNSMNVEHIRGTTNGVLYVCNHRTLLDPLILSYCLRTPLTAVVYSLSRISEIISPMKTVRLTRKRDRDAKLMQKLLSQGDLVVCPEGTTCREPYLLRFSPLFTEISDNIFPVAINCHVSMFYGTTARGFKGLDPLFILTNPWPSFIVHFLEMVHSGGVTGGADKDSMYKLANSIQNMIAKELRFTCTRLTRKDKYLILAGNEGIVQEL